MTANAIRPATAADAHALAAIYAPYVRETTITFEAVPPAADEMAARMNAVRAAALPWLVIEHDGAIVGYAHAMPWKTRAAYRHTVETTVYLNAVDSGRGLGTALYADLLARLRQCDLHVAVGCIALPNPRSVALHEKLGFEQVAHFAEVGRKFDRWLDIGYWRLTL